MHQRADDPRFPCRKAYLIMRDNVNKRNQTQQNRFYRELFDQVKDENDESSNTVQNENSHTFATKSYAEAVRTPHRSHHMKGLILQIPPFM